MNLPFYIATVLVTIMPLGWLRYWYVLGVSQIGTHLHSKKPAHGISLRSASPGCGIYPFQGRVGSDSNDLYRTHTESDARSATEMTVDRGRELLTSYDQPGRSIGDEWRQIILHPG